MTLAELLTTLNLPGDPDALLTILAGFLEAPPGLLTANATVADVLHEWLDIDLSIDEDCLHLAVTTPWRPDGSVPADSELLPVLFFVHGGAFYAGTQIRMGAERLAAWGDVIVVSINYRVGPLGFMCLDTEEAGGNMGMLDMVVALEWVHEHVRRFGGDPSRITVFGESAGSASIGHLLLSESTNGLFAAGIGQSGSAIAPWAFDATPELHARGIAAHLDCNKDNLEDMVGCLRGLPAKNISAAFSAYRTDQRRNGGLGFGGSIPCAQKQGERKFYTADQTPEQILFDGAYEQVPILFGANSYEGSYVYGVVYNDFLVPNNYTEDEEFLRHEFLPYLLRAIGVTNSYAMESTLRREYFDEWQLGNLTAMQAGAIDLLSVFFIKASQWIYLKNNKIKFFTLRLLM
jgi:acetylcholinesterase